LAILVSRLTEQKGLDLVIRILDELLGGALQLPSLASATVNTRTRSACCGEHPGKMAVRLVFDESLSRRFYAGPT
jgi:starch synthase